MNSVEVIRRHIKKNRIFKSDKTYVIEGEVRVAKGVKLTIPDKTTILIVNGEFKKSSLRRSALIFDQGSTLIAERLYVQACNAQYKPVKVADNAGIWFLGNFSDAAKDGMSVKLNRKNPLSNFRAKMIASYYLGRPDSLAQAALTNKKSRSQKEIDLDDDIDGFSVLGVGKNEWAISEVRCYYSADDAFDVTNSHIRLDRLEIKQPVEDGMNMSSSRVEIHKSLNIDVRKNKTKDRDLFDLETDDGASFIELYSRCWVRLNGVFGDQVVLSSTDMPKPVTRDENERSYAFRGQLKSAALIYSIDQD
jgi:hypothetical protein